VSPGTRCGVRVAARAAIERTSLLGSRSNQCDSYNAPLSQRNSIKPSRVSSGREERRKRCGKPGALLLRMIALRTPGPHHSFSELIPNVSDLASTLREDCPKLSLARLISP